MNELTNNFDLKFDHVLIPIFIFAILFLYKWKKWPIYKTFFLLAGGSMVISVVLYSLNSLRFPLLFYATRLADWVFYFLILGVISMVIELIFIKQNK